AIPAEGPLANENASPGKRDMDRKEKPRSRSDFANRGLETSDARVLGSLAGREPNKGADPGGMNEDEIRQPVGAPRRSDVTGRHDAGIGANETADGLSGTEEATRR